MVKLRVGPATDHVLASLGPDNNINRFYHTRYSNEYGKDFKHRTLRDGSTGYSSNFRPYLSCSRSMDNFDNPVMGYLLRDNYETTTKRHFCRTQSLDGSNLPGRIITKADSGFVRERPLTVPTYSQVQKAFYDTTPHGGSSFPGIPPLHRPLLHTLKRHDPTEEENCYRGAQYMSTEMKAKFEGKPTAPLKIHQKDVGNLEETGFTHNKAIEPVTFTYDDDYSSGKQQMYADLALESETHSGFVTWQDSNGRDPLPPIRERTSHETGFVRQKSRHLYTSRNPDRTYLKLDNAPELVKDRTKKNDPSEFLNMVHPHNKKSVTKAQFLGKNKPEKDLSMTYNTGKQELSGNALNNYRYMETFDGDGARYLTNYNLRHYNMDKQGVDREGWVMGGLQKPQEDGYCRDFRVHSFGRSMDTSHRLQRLHPFVGRSLTKQDEFFDDHKYDHKLELSSNYRKANTTATLKAC